MQKHIFTSLLCVALLCACQKSSVAENNSAAESSIIGGESKMDRSTVASRGVVLIELLNSQNQSLTFCSASLIGEHTLLTAGHCFDPHVVRGIANFRVLFESAYKTDEPRQSARGLAYVTHPEYNSKGIYNNDVAVAIFAGDIPTEFAAVNIDTDTKANYSNETVWAYGYGRTQDYTGQAGENLRYSAGKLYRGALKIDAWFSQTQDRYFTAENSPAYICQGDSGGPQFLDKNGVLKIVGVNSAAIGKKLANGSYSCRGRSQATKVAPFAKWIRLQQQALLKKSFSN